MTYRSTFCSCALATKGVISGIDSVVFFTSCILWRRAMPSLYTALFLHTPYCRKQETKTGTYLFVSVGWYRFYDRKVCQQLTPCHYAYLGWWMLWDGFKGLLYHWPVERGNVLGSFAWLMQGNYHKWMTDVEINFPCLFIGMCDFYHSNPREDCRDVGHCDSYYQIIGSWLEITQEHHWWPISFATVSQNRHHTGGARKTHGTKQRENDQFWNISHPCS